MSDILQKQWRFGNISSYPNKIFVVFIIIVIIVISINWISIFIFRSGIYMITEKLLKPRMGKILINFCFIFSSTKGQFLLTHVQNYFINHLHFIII